MPHRPLLLRWPIDTLFWMALAFSAVLLSRESNWDMTVANWFFDAAQQRFPLRDSLLWTSIFHDGSKKLTIALWLGMAAWAWREHRYQRATPWVFALITSVLAVGINGWLKAHSAHSCPWALSALGGTADYFRLLDATPDNPGPGHCLPSGHAAVGFMWIPLMYVVACWWPEQLRRITIFVISFGLFCGGIQIARGAHFPSHVIMAAAVCGLTTSLSFHAYQYRAYLGTAMLRISQRLRAESTK
jgi:membrane-associated PAP2 superfamily phosphatase